MKRLSLLLILSMAPMLAYMCSAQDTNTTSGYHACSHLTSGTDNTCDGYESGFHTSIGSDNTFIGGENGVLNTSGYNNTFLGYQAGFLNTTGYGNVFLGAFAGYNITTGDSNIFIGNIGPVRHRIPHHPYRDTRQRPWPAELDQYCWYLGRVLARWRSGLY